MKKLKKLLIILMGILLISGCTFKNENNMSIDKNGKFEYSILIALDRETLTTILKSENENAEITDEALLKYMNEGIDYPFIEDLEKKEYTTNEFIGYKYTYSVDHIDNISDENIDKININVYDSQEKLIDKKLFKKEVNKYTANFIYNLTSNEEDDYDINAVNFITEFTVTLPYAALEHNAENVKDGGKTLNWIIDKNIEEEIYFTFSLINTKLTNKIIIITLLLIILLILGFILTRKKNNKKARTYCIILVTIGIIATIFTVFFSNTPLVLSQHLNNINENNILYDGETVYLYFEDLDKSADALNAILNYTNSTNNVYTSVVDRLMKKDENIKMYDEDGVKVLETSLKKEDAINLFSNYIDIENDITLKIIFDNDLENKDISDINYKINRERVIRERIVQTALSQVGKTGYTYWNWYNGQEGFMEWCAAFVSWVGDQHGQIESGNIPKFAWVKVGVDFYKDKGQFKYNKDYTPKPGDIVFFNWNNENDLIDHVGIVEKYENGYVYTIEGNVGGTSSMSRSEKAVVRKVVKRKYKKDSLHLYGYGIPEY